MRTQSSIRVFLSLAFALPVGLYFLYAYLDRHYSTLPVLGPVSKVNGDREEHKVPVHQLTNQDGEVSGTAQWSGKIVVADFFFTRCPSICPKMTRSLQKIQAAFGTDEIFLASFSIDPDTDTPEILKAYSRKFRINTVNWHLLTGRKMEIYSLARNGFMITATDGDGGPADFIHSENLVLIDRHRRIRGYYDGTEEKAINTLIVDIKKLKHEK